MSDPLMNRLKRWATEEFNLPAQRLPNDNNLKTICVGPGASIWKYLIEHVYHVKNVRRMRRNLQWYELLQDKELKQEEGQSEAVKRLQLQREIEELRAELTHLDYQISGTEEPLADHKRSIERSCGKMEENHAREVLLQAYRGRCTRESESLSEDTRMISGHCQALDQLSRKAEVELVFFSKASGGPQTEVLLGVRRLCDRRQLFLQRILQSELKTAPYAATFSTREERNAAFKCWLSSLKDVMRDNPPNHFLAALQYLASEEEVMLQEKIASLDVARDVDILGFRYESNRLVDISREEEELPPVSSLLQAVWEEVEQNVVDLAQTRSRIQQLQVEQKQAELESQPVSDVELQCAVQTAVRDSVREECLRMKQKARDGQDALRSLTSQWQSTLHFRKLVDMRQEQIRCLIKANSTAKSDLTRLHNEIGQFVQVMLTPQFGDVTSAAKQLRNGIFYETRQFGAVSMAALDRRTIRGVQRVPAKWLSIHRLYNDSFRTLRRSLSFPLYRAPEQLCSQVLSQRLKLLLQRHLLQTIQKQGVLLPALDQQALCRMMEEDQALLESLLPRLKRLSRLCLQGFAYSDQVKTAIGHWWLQPGQDALPELSKQGLTFQKWLHRWRLASSRL